MKNLSCAPLFEKTRRRRSNGLLDCGLPISGHQEDHDFSGFVPDLFVCSFC